MVMTRSQIVNKKTKIKTIQPSLLLMKKKKDDSSEEDQMSVSSNTNEEHEEHEEHEEEEHEDEEDDDDDDFYLDIPKQILENPELNALLEKIKTYIKEKKIPTLLQILDSKISFKNKVDLFELMILYENTEPYTEESLHYRDAISKLLSVYKKEFRENQKYRKELNVLEKKINVLNDISIWPSKIIKLNTNDYNKETIYKKYIEFKNMTKDDEEYGKLERWMKAALSLPFDNVIEGSIPHNENNSFSLYLKQVKDKLDEKLYGMDDVKEQILLFLHIKLKNPSLQGCCLGLIGPPGCGKTSIARSLADILEYPFEQISFGGVNNTDFLKGYNYTYVGSRPGEIVNCLTRMKYKNGILFFDEYDKITQNPDIIACLLHLTDFSQNNAFRDNYLSDLEVDLSRLWFIYSMNELPENSALRDRIFPIYISGYSIKDKVRIIVDYLFPKHLEQAFLQKSDVIINDHVANFIIGMSCNENDKGIRTIEKAVKDIINKLSFMIIHDSQSFDKMSFFPKSKITLPLLLTNEIVEKCLHNFKTNLNKNRHTQSIMYL
jgi:ATP-dependent Lon protease